MDEIRADSVWAKLGLVAPAALSKQRVVVNNRHNRTLRIAILKLVVRTFAKLNGEAEDGFGLIRPVIGNKHYFYSVCYRGNELVIKPITSFPTGIISGMLEMYWFENAKNSVGIILTRNKLLPVLSDGVSLRIGQWKVQD